MNILRRKLKNQITQHIKMSKTVTNHPWAGRSCIMYLLTTWTYYGHIHNSYLHFKIGFHTERWWFVCLLNLCLMSCQSQNRVVRPETGSSCASHGPCLAIFHLHTLAQTATRAKIHVTCVSLPCVHSCSRNYREMPLAHVRYPLRFFSKEMTGSNKHNI